MVYRTPIVTLQRLRKCQIIGQQRYIIKGISFIDGQGRGHTLYEYTETTEPVTGNQIFELIEKLALNNNYKLARIQDFGVNRPRIVVQFVENPGIFSVPYNL